MGLKSLSAIAINPNKYSKHFLINLFTLNFLYLKIYFLVMQLIYLSIQLSHVFSNLIKQNPIIGNGEDWAI